MNEQDQPVLHVAAKELRIPQHLSSYAQAALAQVVPRAAYPAQGDMEGWRRHVAEGNLRLDALVRARGEKPDLVTEEIRRNGVRIYDCSPHKLEIEGALCLNIHGGSLIHGEGAFCRSMSQMMAAILGARTWAVDYRMPPDHPYPTALEDCMAAYRAALDHYPAGRVIVEGGSAGGNLAAALVLRARDEGVPLPAAVVLRSPEVDLTESGDSFQVNLGVDTVLHESLMPANLLYAGGHDLSDPYLSPLFGDFTKGFPPALITAGTRDLFLSNAVRLHRALRNADLPAELHVWEAMPHGGFFGAPEDQEVEREIRSFCHRHWR